MLDRIAQRRTSLAVQRPPRALASIEFCFAAFSLYFGFHFAFALLQPLLCKRVSALLCVCVCGLRRSLAKLLFRVVVVVKAVIV